MDVRREEQTENRRDGEKDDCEEFDEGRELRLLEEFEFLRDCIRQGRGDNLSESSFFFFNGNRLLSLVLQIFASMKTSSFSYMISTVHFAADNSLI